MKKILALGIILLLGGCVTLVDHRVPNLEKRVTALEDRSFQDLATQVGASFYPARALTGTGGVDAITTPSDKDVAFAVLENDATYGNAMFVYVFNASGAESVDKLPYVIQPDDLTAGDWELVGAYSNQGAAGITTKSEGATLTAAEVNKGLVIVSAAVTIILPQVGTVVPVGSFVMLYSSGANIITIDVHNDDRIVREGTAQNDGVNMTLSAGAGNFVVMFADSAAGWSTAGYKGTLAAGS